MNQLPEMFSDNKAHDVVFEPAIRAGLEALKVQYIIVVNIVTMLFVYCRQLNVMEGCLYFILIYPLILLLVNSRTG